MKKVKKKKAEKCIYNLVVFFIFFQAYAIVADTIDKMEFVFDEIIRNDSSRPPLRPKH